MVKRVFLIIGLTLFSIQSYAQCAMCRATLENNVSNGEIGIASKLNFGIMYLFVMPYLLVAVIAFLWYRNRKLIVDEQRRR